MNITIASPVEIKNLKSEIKSLLESPTGISLFNQRYGRDFSYEDLSKILDSRQYIWVIYSDVNKLMGFAELWLKDNGYFELGYTIFPNYQKLGYGYQLVRKAFIDCKNKLRVKLLKIEAENNNIGSIRIMHKLQDEFPPSRIETNERYDPPTLIYKWKF